ncbi:PerC family transcriptional regulator [Salmonella enterica]|nr:PerC family transcriptional regulator [Salmonella enterica]EBU1139959.1 PerC family transcriptional regulator [Salmonella enterica]
MILDEKAEKPELAGLYRRAAARWLTVAGARIINRTAEKTGLPQPDGKPSEQSKNIRHKNAPAQLSLSV